MFNVLIFFDFLFTKNHWFIYFFDILEIFVTLNFGWNLENFRKVKNSVNFEKKNPKFTEFLSLQNF